MSKSSSRDGDPITLIAIHTNEGYNPPDEFPDKTAENLAAYLDRPDVYASYHRIVDDDSDISYVPDHRAAWALRSGNSRSLNLCFTGWAHWSLPEWLSHRRMLRRAADIVRHWCDFYGVPMVKLVPEEVSWNHHGIIGHVDWTKGKNDGTHWDPGPEFPWGTFMTMIRGEDMAADFHTTRKDWAGNEIAYGATLDWVDRRTTETLQLVRTLSLEIGEIKEMLEVDRARE